MKTSFLINIFYIIRVFSYMKYILNSQIFIYLKKLIYLIEAQNVVKEIERKGLSIRCKTEIILANKRSCSVKYLSSVC